MKLWMYENHICELQSEELRSSQLYTQPLQLRKESLKKKKKLVERCTGIAEVKGSNPVQAWIFFRLSFRKRKSCFYNCDDHPSFNFNDGKVMLLWANSQ